MRFILLIALTAVLSFATPISDHGKLSVKDGKLVDKDEKPYVLRGMSMFWSGNPSWGDGPGPKFYKQSTITTLAGSSWNANVVRAAIGRSSDVEYAKSFMDWTKSAGIYVIIDWHVHSMNLSEAKTFFTTVSNHAKSNNYTHVIYEVFNEPIDQTWTSIKSDAEQLIDAIRANDQDGIIVVGNSGYSSDLNSPRANPITGARAKNVMYTLHFYTSDPSHNVYKGNLKAAYCNNFPVFATEWGTSMADGGDKDKTMNWNLTNSWMSLVESLGISWANWSIVDKDETSAALANGCCGGGTFGDNNLSASGKYVQRIMKNRNSGGSITSANGGDNVNLTQEDAGCSQGVQTGEKNGIVTVGGSATDAVNFLSMSGAKDSAIINSAPVLQNTAATFNVGYKITEFPGPGTYRMRVRYGSTAAATLSWQGSGLESGSAELASTGGTSTWKNSAYFDINITATGETPLNLTFNSGGANNFVLVNVQVITGSSSGGDPSPIISVSQKVANNGAFAIKNGVNLQVSQNANMEVFGLNGKSVRKMSFSNGSYYVSLGDLPKGLYIVRVKFDNHSEILRIPVK